ncbi:MAG: hypothetical protein BJ554DRAFT_5014, partial [Olpidium bornovanus]
DSIPVCHKGYVTLFPLLLGLLPHDSPKVEALLKLMHHPDHLWSPYVTSFPRAICLPTSFPLHFGGRPCSDPNAGVELLTSNPYSIVMSVFLNRYGLRSLSKSDAYYGQGENFWRGPIWVNINFLALSVLHKSYKKTGYVWEQYLDVTGEGRRSHPFTGWTSLITLIMAEED